MNITLYQLRVLVAVADTGGYTHAAKALYTSQPVVSYHLGLLERRLGVKLFERRPFGSVTVTPDGQAVITQARTILHQVRQLGLIAHR